MAACMPAALQRCPQSRCCRLQDACTNYIVCTCAAGAQLEGCAADVLDMNAGGLRKRRAVKLTGESRVFEDGALGEAPGGGRCERWARMRAGLQWSIEVAASA